MNRLFCRVKDTNIVNIVNDLCNGILKEALIKQTISKTIVSTMPIQIQDYEWSQTSTAVIIKVPLKGVPGHKADIFSTDLYVKVTHNIYYL